MSSRGIAILHYDRVDRLNELLAHVIKTMPKDAKLVVCDDGTRNIIKLNLPENVIFIKDPNKGVAANKNRALWALQDCHYIALIEDDLFPTEEGWFETYEEVARLTQNHHFCRVQDKEIKDTYPEFTKFLSGHSYTPVFGSSPRGDFTFITREVVRQVGGFNPLFRGAGYAHGEWSERIRKAGLISHPLGWWDVKEARDKFEQRGDTTGGRWNHDPHEIKEQLKSNKITQKRLKRVEYLYCPLVFE